MNLEKARNKWDEFEKEIAKWNSASLWPPGFKIDFGKSLNQQLE